MLAGNLSVFDEVGVWLLVGSGALMAATVLFYWYVSARDTLDRLDMVLPPRADEDLDDVAGDDDSEGRSKSA